MAPIASTRFRIFVAVSVGITVAFVMLTTVLFVGLPLISLYVPNSEVTGFFSFVFLPLSLVSFAIAATMFSKLRPPETKDGLFVRLRFLRAWFVLNLGPFFLPVCSMSGNTIWPRDQIRMGVIFAVFIFSLWLPDIIYSQNRLAQTTRRTPRRKWSQMVNFFIAAIIFAIVFVTSAYGTESIFGNDFVGFLVSRFSIPEILVLGLLLAVWLAVAYVGARFVFLKLEWKRVPVNAPLCDGCGYDLTGNQSGRCPECGRPWSGPVCEKCGYLLSGNTSGICPECGTRFLPDVAASPA